MLTPTGVTASAYWDAIKAGNRTHIKMTFTGQSVVLEDEDIYLNSGVTINDILNSDTDLVFGNAVAKQLRATILNSSKVTGLDWTGEFKLEFGVEIGSPAVTNWVTIGYFTGEKPKNVNNVSTIDFTAYDRMKKFDTLADDFFDAITYPITVQEIYDDLCTFVGVTNVSGDELPNIMSRSYTAAPVDMVGYTCRDILSWIAQSCGCYAKVTDAGTVKMVWFTDHTNDVNITASEEFNFECADDNVDAIDLIIVKQVGSDLEAQYPASVSGNAYTIIDNPFLGFALQSDITNYIKPLYDRLDSFGVYLPCGVQCIGNWLVETGDIISVDINGNTVSMPLFVRTIKWGGGIEDTYETTGNKSRLAYNSDKDKQKVLSAKEIKLIVGDRYYEKKSGIVIDQSGVSISASKTLSIESGGTIDIDTTNMTLSSDDGYFSITYQEFLLNHIFEVGKNLYHVYTQDSPYSSVMSFIQAPGESRQISGQTTVVKYNGLQIHMENAYDDNGVTKYYGGNINFAVTRGTWYKYDGTSETLYTVSLTPSRTAIDTNAYFALGTSEYPWHYAYITTLNASYINTGKIYSPNICGSSSNSLTNGITFYPHFGTSSYIRVRADNISTPTKFTFSSDVSILFDGEATTASKWTTSRNFTIKDADSTNTGSATSVNGSGNVTLYLPSTIKATLTGSATSAGKWTTARNFTIKDADAVNSGSASSVNGTGDVILSLPSTIKASITGNCSGSAGSVAWANVTGKPSSYTPSSHTHSNIVIAGTNTQSTKTSDYALNGMNVRWFTQTSKVPSQPTQYGFLLTLANSDNSSENHQIWAEQANGSLYHRGTNASSYTSPPAFKTILDSSNYTNWCSPKADSAFQKLQNTYSGSVRTVTQTFSAYAIGMVVVTSYQGSSWGAGVWIVICYDGTTPGVATQVVNANTGAVVTVTGKTVSVKATGNIMIYALL